MRFKILITLMVITFFSLMSLGVAQEVLGNISGTVTDSSGAAIPNATVTVTNTSTGTVARVLKSNADGSYTAPSLPIGTYSVTAEAGGFSKTVVSNIELNVNDKLSINPSLKAGSAGEVITVEANPLEVETQTATSSTLISGEQIRELSLNNRNYIQLVSLMPGVSFGGSDQLYIGTT
ncbi:MAG TPA: carboxypeptidase-like regulatory domain-containing protein, partial [Terriglobales bacterium]|nr:carboxypeptidase-like regulatory domain-containing protein [Terriglobales bacterium]